MSTFALVKFFTEEDRDKFLDELRHRKTIVVENAFGNHRFDIDLADRAFDKELKNT